MMYNNILLNLIQAGIPHRVAQSGFRMGEAVQLMLSRRFMPVIQKIIMQQGTPHKRTGIDRNPIPSGKRQTDRGNRAAMMLDRRDSMLSVILRLLQSRMQTQLPAFLQEQLLIFIR